MMIIKGIKQFGEFDFRYAVNSLSFVTKSKNYKNIWCWDIDLSKIDKYEIYHKLSSFKQNDVENFQNLIKNLVRESGPKHVEEKPKFDNFIKKLEMKQKHDPTIYTVIGDIIDKYSCPTGLLYTLLDNHNINKTIQLFIPTEIIKRDLKTDELDNIRVKVSGTVQFYSPKASMQMIAHSIKILGVCSRLDEERKYEKECKPYFRNCDEQKNFTINNTITNVGLITGGTVTNPIQGAKDFINKLQIKLKNSLHIEYIKISDVNEIIAALHRLNEDGTCQIIAIVRGGGSKESLACYSDPKLVKAIFKSPIPVVTGIGHSSDNLLCEKAACYNAGTPTEAATFINKQYYHKNHDQREHYDAKTEYERILANFSKENLFEENENLKEDLELLKQENQLLKQKLDKIKQRSLLNRILNR